MATYENLLPTPNATNRESTAEQFKTRRKKMGGTHRGVYLADELAHLTSSREASLASPSPKPDEEKERMMTVTSGRKCSGLLRSSDPAGILSMVQHEGKVGVEAENGGEDDHYDGNEAGGILWDILNDLEEAGYAIQTFVIPAVAVNAPHRRDRVWIVAHRTGERPFNGFDNREERHLLRNENGDASQGESERDGRERGIGEVGADAADGRCIGQEKQELKTTGSKQYHSDASNARQQFGKARGKQELERKTTERTTRTTHLERFDKKEWARNWLDVALATCDGRVDDGLPARMDGLELSKSKHRAERLKGLGNAWVPQVAIQILKGIRAVDNSLEK